MRLVAVLACLGLCAGCAAVDRKLTVQADRATTSERSYAVARAQTANVGDLIVRIRDYTTATAPAKSVRADRDFVLSGGLDRIRFKEGEHLDVIGRRRGPDGRTRLVVEKSESFLIEVDDEGVISPSVRSDIGFGASAPMLARFHPHPAAARLTPVRRHEVEERGFGDNYDLLFSGADAGSVHLTLREYWRDDLDRPALQQTLTFPLNGSQIHFRKLTLTLKTPDPEHLTYVVQSDAGH